MKRLIKFIALNPLDSVFNYYLRVLLAIEIPSLTFALISVRLINSEWFLNNLGDAKVKSTMDPLAVLVIAPVVETFILALLIKILSEKIKSKFIISLLIGAISSIAHGLQSTPSILSAGWTFFMFSLFFIEMEISMGYWVAFRLSMLMHLTINLFAFIIFTLAI